jgi:hypothetical protein
MQQKPNALRLVRSQKPVQALASARMGLEGKGKTDVLTSESVLARVGMIEEGRGERGTWEAKALLAKIKKVAMERRNLVSQRGHVRCWSGFVARGAMACKCM